MIAWALAFLMASLISGVLAFGVVSGPAVVILKVSFVVFLLLFMLSLFSGAGMEPDRTLPDWWEQGYTPCTKINETTCAPGTLKFVGAERDKHNPMLWHVKFEVSVAGRNQQP